MKLKASNAYFSEQRFFNIENGGYTMFWKQSANIVRGNHCVYQAAYHIVLVAYKRKDIITDEVSELVISLTTRMLEEWGGRLIEAKPDKDHIHLLISVPPKLSLSTCIGTIKQVTAKHVHKQLSYLEHLPKNGRLWGSSFYMSTVGETDMETVKEYIRLQGIETKRGRPSKGHEQYKNRERR